MWIRDVDSIKNNYDTTVVIPCIYTGINYDKLVQENLDYFRQNGLDIILLCSSDIYMKVDKAFLNTPFINIKCFVLPDTIFSKLLCDSLRLALKISEKKHVVFFDPRCHLSNDGIYIFRLYLEFYSNCLLTAKCHTQVQEILDESISIFACHQNTLENISLECESLSFNELAIKVSQRLQNAGVDILLLPEIDCHITENSQLLLDGEVRPDTRSADDGLKEVFTWRNNPNSFENLIDYTRIFEKVDCTSKANFETPFKVVALVQTYNEEKNILGLLEHLETLCDGVIVLDDGSSDNTYEMISSTNLLIKVKKRRGIFNDLENRNTLLKLASFIKTEWLFYIDADERFDTRYSNLYEYIESGKSDVLGFYVANIWDKPGLYRSDIVDSENINSRSGLLFRLRMFKNIGYMQIRSKKILHFSTVPYFGNFHKPKILLLHYGLYQEYDRLKKYSFYEKQDDQFNANDSSRMYDLLNDKNVQLKSIEDISL